MARVYFRKVNLIPELSSKDTPIRRCITYALIVVMSSNIREVYSDTYDCILESDLTGVQTVAKVLFELMNSSFTYEHIQVYPYYSFFYLSVIIFSYH